MHDFFSTLSQKVSEMGCEQLANVCPNVLLEQLNCLLESTSAAHCKTLATEVCYDFLQECPKVWARQYALPVAVVTGAVFAGLMFCSRPRR